MNISIDNSNNVVFWIYDKEDIINIVYSICLEELAKTYKEQNIHYTEQLDHDELTEKIEKVLKLFIYSNKIHKYINYSYMDLLYAIIDKFYIASGAKEAIYKDYPYLVNSSNPYTYFVKVKNLPETE